MKEGEKLKIGSATCKVKFLCWRNPPKHWGSWIKNLCSVHQSTWKDVGIFEAIMCSTYAIKGHDDLIMELASRWCLETNTFNFPWGEATLTLEEMLVLGGFSALGVSTLHTLDDDEAKSLKIVERLESARKELIRTRAHSALHGKWLEKFKGCGSGLEHAAFLSLWLSRFVFPLSAKCINKCVFPVAARLSRGIKIALGPAVLAMLYRDLSTLARRLKSRDNVGQVGLCGLFNLVQLWAWERFPMLKPVPNRAFSGDNFPRLARWSNVKIPKDKDLRSAIDSVGKAFLWCPYASSDLGSFGRCMKPCELRGFDSCIVRYQPERVAKQFGLDQDILNDKMTDRNTSSSQMVEKAVDCRPPGFPARIEAINVVDSDDDCSLKMTIASPDVAKENACFVDKTEESESDEDGDKNDNAQVQQQHTNTGSSTSNHESNEVIESVHGVGEVADTKHDKMEVSSTGNLQNDVAMSCDAESYTNEGSEYSDLEARISRLERIVYAHIKSLEASKQH